MDEPIAIGMLPGGDAWIGLSHQRGGYRLAMGSGDRIALADADADADLLIVLAIAYFEQLLDEPPVAHEATHADIADVVRAVAEAESDPGRRRLLAEAVDAIDDGLGADAVAGCLVAARQAADEQADLVDLLVRRANEALRS